MEKLRVVYGELTLNHNESTCSLVSLAASSSLKESRIKKGSAFEREIPMDHSFSGGGNWTMIPSLQAQSGSPAHSNQDQFFLPSNNHNLPSFSSSSSLTSSSSSSSFNSSSNISNHSPNNSLVENLADAIENGTRDQHSDALVNELNTQFDKCQHLLNSISSSINAKAMTVEGQKRKLEESEQLLNQRRELIGKYRNSVEELLKSEP
uniref:Uncharacterized protein n=1 Tax=Salix viminalis TaxID=40686 RepID=A0A6N2N5F7_SALVM